MMEGDGFQEFDNIPASEAEPWRQLQCHSAKCTLTWFNIDPLNLMMESSSFTD